MTLPQPCWFSTGATEWIMSQCHHTESQAWTSGIPLTASISSGCQVVLAGNKFGRMPRHVPVRTAGVTGEPALAGVRSHALDSLRAAIVAGAARRGR